MASPDTPPELASPTATSLSSRSSPSADHVWASQALAVLPMSNYDKTTGRDDDDNHRESAPQDAPQKSHPQQLPSFSSLFGSPSSMRPLGSIPSRPAHYPMHSPLDRLPSLAAGNQSSPSYFPSLAAQPRIGYEDYPNDRRRSLSGSRSPGLGESGSQTDGEPRWPQHETERQDYMQGTQDTARRHLPESRDVSMDYKKETTSSETHGESASESVAPKDTLGPKIWTGTHFLPRFVRAAEVPGEGMCYFYDDGSHCKTIIDGEHVNAHWGVTKAGKPRKRLAIACVTCREKKIKCDPDYPRCVQCEKFGRICKFKNAPRGGHTTSQSAQSAELFRGKMASSPRGSRDSRSPITQPAYHMSLGDSYNKRLRVGTECYSPSQSSSVAAADALDHSKSPQPPYRRLPDISRIPDDVLHRAWLTDVYESDPRSITDVLTKFFVHVDSTMLIRFLPETVWKTHLANSSDRKPPEDLMLLYSILTIGVVLSGGSKHIALEYAQVAHYAQKNLGFDCLQLVQSRILMVVYYISIDCLDNARELLSSALAVAVNLQLNLEPERFTGAKMTTFPLGMNRIGYEESRRRTLWSLFILERLSGIFPDRSPMVNPEDLYIRLPTDNLSFEKQIERDEPLFDPYDLATSTRAGSRNVLAGLVEMVHLWSECQAILYRIACRPATSSGGSARVQILAKKIRRWFSSLPENLSFSMGNLKEALYTESAGSFISLHLLYHYVMIKVNRHHHSAAALLGSQVQSSSLHNCFGHAAEVMGLLQTLDSLRHTQLTLAVLPRVTAMAVVEAVDTLTANGVMSGLSDQINSTRGALMAVERLSNMWDDMARSRIAIRKRLDKLLYIRNHSPSTTSPGCGYSILETSGSSRWQIHEPIDTLLPRTMDIVYTVPL
ncbi:C6 transcription factor [Cordyceps javanica]|uniref:C6 transcription factor n=1 Tax=Cordyceps javanica TaxID=43265 RepID=A0A545WAY3_9HYPO|nr:C6 transcription factor [Cordyceps javanica]TQW11108.1 C6 transcription factor [Cordyceps javanica]